MPAENDGESIRFQNVDRETYRDHILTALHESYLGERKPIHDLAGQIFDMRTAVRAFQPTQEHSNPEYIIEESPLWKERERIMKGSLTEDQLEQVFGLNALLSTVEAKNLQPILDSLIDFQEQMLIDMGVDPANREKALGHVKRVVEMAQKAPKGTPLLDMIASVHDLLKYSQKGFLLGEHEVASAIAGSDVLAKALEAAGYKPYAEATRLFAEKAILCHGEGEFPELKAANNPINAEKGMYDLYVDPQKKFYMGVFLKPPRSSEIHISEVPKEKSASVEFALDLARQTVEGLSEIDKLDGISNQSFAKYIEEMKVGLVQRFATVKDAILSLTDTYILNYKNAPSAVGAKEDPRTQLMRFKTHMLATLVSDFQDGMVDDSTREDYIRILNQLGNDVESELIMSELSELFSCFQNGKNELDDTRKLFWVARFNKHFSRLASALDSIHTATINDSIILNPKHLAYFSRRLSSSNMIMRQHAGAPLYD